MTFQRHCPARAFTRHEPGRARCVIVAKERDSRAHEALPITFLCDCYGLTPGRAVMLASFIWGGGHE